MTSLAFTYHGNQCHGNFVQSDKGKGWYKVIFFDHSAHIMPVDVKTKHGKTVWVQSIQMGEAVWPHELIQLLGELIEEQATS